MRRKLFLFLFSYTIYLSLEQNISQDFTDGKKLNGTIISSGYLKASGSQKVLNGFFSRRCSRFHTKVFSPFFFLTQFQTLKKRSWKNKVFFWNIFLEKWKWKNILLKFIFLSSTHEKKNILKLFLKTKSFALGSGFTCKKDINSVSTTHGKTNSKTMWKKRDSLTRFDGLFNFSLLFPHMAKKNLPTNSVAQIKKSLMKKYSLDFSC